MPSKASSRLLGEAVRFLVFATRHEQWIEECRRSDERAEQLYGHIRNLVDAMADFAQELEQPHA